MPWAAASPSCAPPLHLAGGERGLSLVLHHIVSDGWSMGILVRETAALYGAARARRPWPLPELPVQYLDYAIWQRGWLSGDVLAEQRDWWRRELAGAPTSWSSPPTARARRCRAAGERPFPPS